MSDKKSIKEIRRLAVSYEENLTNDYFDNTPPNALVWNAFIAGYEARQSDRTALLKLLGESKTCLSSLTGYEDSSRYYSAS
jgi:hypothetical protein